MAKEEKKEKVLVLYKKLLMEVAECSTDVKATKGGNQAARIRLRKRLRSSELMCKKLRKLAQLYQ